MATFVLIHGGWIGGWVWRSTAQQMRQAGHEVFCPTVTGQGERAHLASPEIDLHTQIQDVCGVLTYEDLQDVIMVGHSAGVMSMVGAAEKEAARLIHLVYLDTLIPRDGLSFFDLWERPFVQAMTNLALTEGEGWHIPPTLLPYSDSRFTSTLFKPVTQPLSISNSDAAKLARSFIHCTDKPADWLIGGSFAIQQAGAQARSNGWDYYELPTGHVPMLTMPDALTEVLLTIAQKAKPLR